MSTAQAQKSKKPQEGEGTGTAVAKPADTVRLALEKMKPQLAMALPRHLTPDRLLRVAMTAIQNTPNLLECDRTSLYSAIMTCAQLGLEPDGVLGQAYLVPFAAKVQFIPGYRGFIALARNSGEVLSIVAHEVCANDVFGHWNERTKRYELNMASPEPPEHRVPDEGNRGDIRRFYAIARFRDGGCHWDAMTRAEVDTIRDASKGYQAAKRYAKNGVIESPWEQHYPEMGKKTVIRRISKYLPMSVQKAAAIADSFDAGRHSALDTHGDVVIDAEAREAADLSRQVAQGGSKLEAFEKEHGEEGERQEASFTLVDADGVPAKFEQMPQLIDAVFAAVGDAEKAGVEAVKKLQETNEGLLAQLRDADMPDQANSIAKAFAQALAGAAKKPRQQKDLLE